MTKQAIDTPIDRTKLSSSTTAALFAVEASGGSVSDYALSLMEQVDKGEKTTDEVVAEIIKNKLYLRGEQ